MVTIASPGRLRSGCGGSVNSVVAESGPPWPGDDDEHEAHGEAGEGEHQHDPPARRVDAERVGERVVEQPTSSPRKAVQRPEQQCREHADERSPGIDSRISVVA